MSCELLTQAAIWLALAAVGDRAALEPLPSLEFEGVEATVVEQIEAVESAIEAMSAEAGADSRQLADLYGQLGRIYLAYQRPGAAIPVLRNARMLSPRDPDWAYYLAVAYGHLRRDAEAEEALTAVLELRGDDLPTLMRLARLHLRANRPDDAARLLDRALELDPDSAAARFALGQVAQARGDDAVAVDQYRRALELDPAGTVAHYPLALALRDLGDAEAARRHTELRGDAEFTSPDPLVESLDDLAIGAYYQVAIASRAAVTGDLDAAIAAYRRALEVEPESTDIRRHLAVVLARDRRIEEAKTELQRVLAEDPGDALAHFLYGTALLAQDDLAAAEVSLERALELDPRNVEALTTLGAIAEQKNDLAMAERRYRALLEIDPDEPTHRFLFAKVLAMSGRTDEARLELERVVTADPGQGEAQLYLGVLLEQAGETEAALERYRNAASLEGQPQVQGMAFLRQAQLLTSSGAGEAATDPYERAVALLPKSFDARLALANALGRLERYVESADAFDQALELGPEDPSAHIGRALARIFAGDESRALAELEESTAALPSNVELRHLLARLLATASDDSVRDGERALDLAQSVAQREQRIDYVETVAMALAELGRFDEAVDLQQRILDEARRVGATPLVPAIETRLAGYRSGEPARDVWRR